MIEYLRNHLSIANFPSPSLLINHKNTFVLKSCQITTRIPGQYHMNAIGLYVNRKVRLCSKCTCFILGRYDILVSAHTIKRNLNNIIVLLQCFTPTLCYALSGKYFRRLTDHRHVYALILQLDTVHGRFNVCYTVELFTLSRM